MSQGVVFRRIGGRVIPIRQKAKENAKAAGKGAAIAGAGVGVGLAGGIASATLDERSHKLYGFSRSAEFRSDRLWKADRGMTAIKHMRKSEELLQRSVRVGKLGTKAGHLGQVGSAALIGAGIDKALSKTKYKNNTEVRAASAAAGGVAGSFLVKGIYDSKLNKGMKTGKAVRGLFRTVVRKAFRLV